MRSPKAALGPAPHFWNSRFTCGAASPEWDVCPASGVADSYDVRAYSIAPPILQPRSTRQHQPTVQSLTQPWQPPYQVTTPYSYSRPCTPALDAASCEVESTAHRGCLPRESLYSVQHGGR